jgi:hypothetical protein
MFSWWGHTVVRLRWLLVAVTLAFVAVGAAWGGSVFDRLSSGGFDDPDSESAQAIERIATELGRQDADVVVLYSSETTTVDDPAVRDPITDTLDDLRRDPHVVGVVSYYDAESPTLVAADRHSTYATITLDADDDDTKLAAYEEIESGLAAPGVTTQVGGVVAFQAAADEQVERDLARGVLECRLAHAGLAGAPRPGDDEARAAGERSRDLPDVRVAADQLARRQGPVRGEEIGAPLPQHRSSLQRRQNESTLSVDGPRRPREVGAA